MTAPNQLPDGVAPLVGGLAAEFAGIRHGVEEAARRSPPVITFPPPPPPPVQDTNFIRPETASAAGVSLSAGWSNYGAGYQNVSYQMVGTRAFLRGLLTNATAIPASGSGSVNDVIILPTGVRPAASELLPVVGGDPVAIGRLDIYTSGVCRLFGIALPAGGYVSLSGVTFSTIAL